ncbi:adenylate/guanylate cyclase domain-containing protein [Synechococcus sp. Tobar12-5m-g]|uniref:adenylate/guanylate cyclase domain-containing protein n=1 Tax=unclassified Synechococcus TaxID=2626047 RepID=UPI0020CE9A03|nr:MULTISPECIES: adenylate/guanylate cyclase domain-containing protein [unclassified Synechococcus]MCP9772882.1 adenylate/guanylate cyclase domain-containing protein [Synechococcus sp. Tobar12-5m-g]MCP9873652.1 adenylate/guanylate cyclase domain-containing protein [Synechococcus sp. Cruz CV-v-12]
MRTPRPWWLALAAPLLLALPGLGPTPPGQALALADAQLQQLFFRLRGPRAAAMDPVILAIDSESLQLGELLGAKERQASPLWRRMGAWPWPRAVQAELAAAVLRRGAARVLFNIEFSQPSRYGPADDRAFVETLAPWHRQVHLAATYAGGDRGELVQVQLRRPIVALAAPGLTTLLQSPQGVAEAVPGRRWLRENLAGFPLPHPLPLAFLVRPEALTDQPLGINVPGPAGTTPRLPAWRVLEAPAAFWRGRTVLIGATAPELGDQQETPFGAQSGTEVQAAAIANVLRGDGLRPLPAAGEALLLLAWAAGVLWVLGRGGTSARSFALTAALMTTALGASFLLWLGAHLLLPLATLLLMPLLGGGVRGGGQALAEARERAYLHQVLARRISPTLLRDILRDPGPLWNQAGGRRARCVVLFSDLEGFTPLSASLEPGELFSLLNRYFETMAAAVLEEQGLLDKFIGDTLMAEFGVPRSRGDREEARAAVRAALSMQRRLETLNAELAATGQPPLRHGIGLHVGDVIAGNLGSSQRLEFTVVGATVNVASRLEGLTRRFPEHSILISGDLLALLPDELVVEPLGRQRVKGWPTALEVFGLEGIQEHHGNQ